MGEAVGKLYVAKYFPPEAKARMDELVKNLLAAYKQSIDTLDWMSPETEEGRAGEAREVHRRRSAIPTSGATIRRSIVKRDDLVGNVIRGNAFEYQRNIAKLGKPVDRAEWGMTPQTVNAYYNPEHERDRLPGRDPAAAVLRREGRRRGQLRRHRRGDRPRDQPRLRRPGLRSTTATATCATGGRRTTTRSSRRRRPRSSPSTTRSSPCRAIQSTAT